MIISLKNRFIFVANLKVASTATEKALNPFAEISIDVTDFGKHFCLHDIEQIFSALFAALRMRDFFVVGTIRNPWDWLSSLYRSHKSVHFEGTEASTLGMSFSEFLSDWCERFPDQAMPQMHRLLNGHDLVGVDFLMRFEMLAQDFGAVTRIIGLPDLTLEHENISIDIDDRTGLSDADEQLVANRYAIDFYAHERLTGRPLKPMERVLPEDFSDALRATRAASDSYATHQPIERKVITRDDVIWGYRMLLGREPESEEVLTTHLSLGSRDRLRTEILNSDEFSSICAHLAQKK